MPMLKVHFEKENRTIEVEEAENLREAAIRNTLTSQKFSTVVAVDYAQLARFKCYQAKPNREMRPKVIN